MTTEAGTSSMIDLEPPPSETQGDNKDDGPALCTSCSETYDSEAMYRCKSCQTAPETSEAFYCKICVVGPHLRKKHDIVDHNGYEPAVCQRHRNLSQHFCKTCAHVFCTDCITDHSSHVFHGVEQEAKELRKKVFEYFTSYELMEKPLLLKETLEKESVQKIKEVSELLRSSEVNETLCREYEKCISTTKIPGKIVLRKFKNSGQKIHLRKSIVKELKKINSEAKENNIHLKEMLKKSASCFITQFLACEYSLKKSDEEQTGHLSNHRYLQWTEDLETAVENSVKEVLRSVEIPQIEETGIESIEVKRHTEAVKRKFTFEWGKATVTVNNSGVYTGIIKEYFNLSIFNGSLSFSLLGNNSVNTSYSGSSTWRATSKSSLFVATTTPVSFSAFKPQRPLFDYETDFPSSSPFEPQPRRQNSDPSMNDIELRGITAQYVLFESEFVAVCSHSLSVSVFSLTKNEVVYNFQLDPNCIPLTIEPLADNKFACLEWYKARSMLKFTDKETLQQPMTSFTLPENPKQVQRASNLYAFLALQNTVKLWNRNTDLRLDISQLHHGLHSVDNMKLPDENTIFLINYKRLLVVKFKFTLASWPSHKCSLEKISKITPFSNDPPKLITVIDDRIVTCSNSDEIYMS